MRGDREAERGRWAVAAMFLINGFIMGAWAPQIPLLLPRHQITESTLGLLILTLGLGAVGAMLFAGRLIARIGSRRMVILFGWMSVFVLPAVVLSPNLWLITLALVAFGGIVGCMDVSMNANAVAVERRLKRAIMSSSHGFWSLGGFVGGAIGALALARFGAEAQAIGVGAICAGIMALALPHLITDEPLAIHVGEGPSAPLPQRPAEKRPLLPRDGALWLLGFMTLFSMVPEGAVLDWAAIYLNKELGADLTVAGMGFALFSGTMALMRFLGDGVRNRFGAVRTLRYSGFIGAAGLLTIGLAPSPVLAIAGCALAGIGVANMVPILFSAAGNHPGMTPGAGIATVTMLGYSGILFAPGTIGFIAEHTGFRATYLVLGLILLTVAALAGRAAAADRIGH
jgi:MFS family permease